VTSDGAVFAVSDAVYTPDSEFSGADSFEVAVADLQGHETSATVQVAVEPVPDVSNVNLDESGDALVVTFESDDPLGTSSADVAATVTGPSGTTYAFDRTDFSESGSGPYTYELETIRPLEDGDGAYSIAVEDAISAAGHNGGLAGVGSGLTDEYAYRSDDGSGGSDGVGDGDGDRSDPASVTLADQTTDGRTITVESYAFGTEGAVLAIWNGSRDDPGTVLGTVTTPSTGAGLSVTLDEPVTDNGTLVAAVHSTTGPSPSDTLAVDDATITVETGSSGPVSPLSGAPGQFDSDADGEIGIQELGQAAAAYVRGRIDIRKLGNVANVFSGA